MNRVSVHFLKQSDPSAEKMDISKECAEENRLGISQRVGQIWVPETCAGYPVTTRLEVAGHEVELEFDTGSVVTLMPGEAYRKILPQGVLKWCDLSLRVYTGEKVRGVGVSDVDVASGHGKHVLPLVVVGNGNVRLPTLLGRNSLQQVKLDWRSVFAVTAKKKTLKMLKVIFQLAPFNMSPGPITNTRTLH